MEAGVSDPPTGTGGAQASGADSPFASPALRAWMCATGFLPPSPGEPPPEPGTASERAGAGWRARLSPFIEAARAHGAIPAPPGSVPMLARDGAAIALRDPAGCGPPAEAFHLFAGTDGGLLPRIRMTSQGAQVQIELAAEAGAPEGGVVLLRVHGIRRTPDLVSRDGVGEPPRSAPDFSPSDWRGWHYDRDRGTATLAAPGRAAGARILISEPPRRYRPRPHGPRSALAGLAGPGLRDPPPAGRLDSGARRGAASVPGQARRG